MWQDQDWEGCKFKKGQHVHPRDINPKQATIWRISCVSKNHGGQNYYHCEAPGFGAIHLYESEIRLTDLPISNLRPMIDRRVYVAGRLDNAATVREAQAMAKQAGCLITYDWTTHGSVSANPELWSQCSVAEVTAAATCCLLVAFLPGGRGTHCEIGLALGSDRCESVVLVGAETTDFCLFYKHPKVEHVAMSEWRSRLPLIYQEH